MAKTRLKKIEAHFENLWKADIKCIKDTGWQAHYPTMTLESRTVRKIVLNQLNLSELTTLSRAEVQQVIDTVDRFTL